MGPFAKAAPVYHSMGMNVLPVALGGKKPAIPWQHLTQERMDSDELQRNILLYGDLNVGVVTGVVSGLAVVDIDGPGGIGVEEKLPPTVTVKTSRGRHYWYRLTSPLKTCPGVYPCVDLKADGGYVLAPPSVHPDGTHYSATVKGKFKTLCDGMAAFPPWLARAALLRAATYDRSGLPDAILHGTDEGGRNNFAAKYAGLLISKGYGETECLRMLRVWNAKNRPPLPDHEIVGVYNSIVKLHQSREFEAVTGKAIEEARSIISKWIYLEHESVIDVLLAVAAMVRYPGDPLWLMLVAPPGSGKTELLRSLRNYQDTYFLDKINTATFITGKREAQGVLETCNNKSFLLIGKDFGDVLTAEGAIGRGSGVMQQLRGIFDGEYSARYGNEKACVEWRGKANLLSGITQDIESSKNQTVMGPLGERFLYYKMLPSCKETVDKMARAAEASVGKEKEMRADIARVMLGVLRELLPKDPARVKVPEHIMEWTTELCKLMVRMRVVVRRVGKYEETQLIDYKPSPEAPTRMLKGLKMLLMGLAFVNGREEADIQDYKIAAKVALDSMNSFRRDCLRVLMHKGAQNWATCRELSIDVKAPAATVLWALDNLIVADVIERISAECLKTVPQFGEAAIYRGVKYMYRIREETVKSIEACGIQEVI